MDELDWSCLWWWICKSNCQQPLMMYETLFESVMLECYELYVGVLIYKCIQFSCDVRNIWLQHEMLTHHCSLQTLSTEEKYLLLDNTLPFLFSLQRTALQFLLWSLSTPLWATNPQNPFKSKAI